MTDLRPFRRQDLDSLYAISLGTGLDGADASAMYRDGRMMGHIYSAPYALLSPATAFVAEDSEGVAGFIVGAIDTHAFEDQLEREWWPALRAIYEDPSNDPPTTWSADQRRGFMIHHPRRTPATIVEVFPAHIHMNLLPRMQGRGLGRALIEIWLGVARRMGVTGIHVEPSAQNHRAIRFWQSCGFERVETSPASPASSPIWLGRHLDRTGRASA